MEKVALAHVIWRLFLKVDHGHSVVGISPEEWTIDIASMVYIAKMQHSEYQSQRKIFELLLLIVLIRRVIK